MTVQASPNTTTQTPSPTTPAPTPQSSTTPTDSSTLPTQPPATPSTVPAPAPTPAQAPAGTATPSYLSKPAAGVVPQAKPTSTPTPTPTPTSGSVPAQAPQAPFRIQPLGQVRKTRYLNLLVYGKFGVGKTTLVGSAVDVPFMRDVLMISAEGGEMSLEDNPRVANFLGVDIIQVRNFNQLNAVRDFLVAHCRFRDMKSAEGDDQLWRLQEMLFGPEFGRNSGERLRKFESLLVDSLTEINDMCLAHLLGMHAGMNLTSEPPAAEFKEYKQNYTKMNMFIRMMRDLPLHVLMTAGASFEQDEQKRWFWMPTMTGQLRSQIQGIYDIVAFLSPIGNVSEQAPSTRRLFVQPVGQFDAKCRIASCTEAFFDNPTMAIIMSKTGRGK